MAFSRGECLLKPLRIKKGLSQADVARKSGYKPRMISFFENNERPMSVEAMWIISGLLDCQMEDLYSGMKRTPGSD